MLIAVTLFIKSHGRSNNEIAKGDFAPRLAEIIIKELIKAEKEVRIGLVVFKHIRAEAGAKLDLKPSIGITELAKFAASMLDNLSRYTILFLFESSILKKKQTLLTIYFVVVSLVT